MAPTISIKVVKKALDTVPWSKVVSMAANASKGDRLWPTRTNRNEAKSNFRLDKGSVVNGLSELIFQANLNAEDKNVREAAQKNSHAILAKGLADPVNDSNGDKAKSQILDDFRNRK